MDRERMTQDRIQRVKALETHGSIAAAVDAGTIPQFADVTLNEALVLGLANQGVRNYIGIFGHGSTDLGEILRLYARAGIRTLAVHHETMAAHAASALYWQYGETAAVFTSIGPGAMHALAGSLTALSNGAGVYYLLGDETTHDEGPNMQQIPRREQSLFLKLTSVLGPSYNLHTPEAVNTALRRGLMATRHPIRASPYYLSLPMNTQPAIIRDCNLLAFPEMTSGSAVVCGEESTFDAVVKAIQTHEKIVIKIGGGARHTTDELVELAELVDAVVVTGPQVPGVFPFSHRRNMRVGGSKGSISGNFAMNEADLAILVGARGVCQWDCSGVAWKNVDQFINFNTNVEDATHYNRTIPVVGDAKRNLQKLIAAVKQVELKKSPSSSSAWLTACEEKRTNWDDYRQLRYETETLYDEAFQQKILTQPVAIKVVCDFAAEIDAAKFFDAGDVQANGFQIVEDEKQGQTFTDTGASYMGFAVSSLLSSAMVDNPTYPIAFCGEGSFWMNPQIITDAVEHRVHGMIVIFDNRRMGAISGLQCAQYEHDYATNDSVVVDYLQLCNAISGVKAVSGGYSRLELDRALRESYRHPGLSVVHVPVYFGPDELGGLGAWGQWNVGNWCEDVQREHQELGL